MPATFAVAPLKEDLYAPCPPRHRPWPSPFDRSASSCGLRLTGCGSRCKWCPLFTLATSDGSLGLAVESATGAWIGKSLVRPCAVDDQERLGAAGWCASPVLAIRRRTGRRPLRRLGVPANGGLSVTIAVESLGIESLPPSRAVADKLAQELAPRTGCGFMVAVRALAGGWFTPLRRIGGMDRDGPCRDRRSGDATGRW
jgi:hypothetical protein